jgi:hypothetical protein
MALLLGKGLFWRDERAWTAICAAGYLTRRHPCRGRTFDRDETARRVVVGRLRVATTARQSRDRSRCRSRAHNKVPIYSSIVVVPRRSFVLRVDLLESVRDARRGDTVVCSRHRLQEVLLCGSRPWLLMVNRPKLRGGYEALARSLALRLKGRRTDGRRCSVSAGVHLEPRRAPLPRGARRGAAPSRGLAFRWDGLHRRPTIISESRRASPRAAPRPRRRP